MFLTIYSLVFACQLLFEWLSTRYNCFVQAIYFPVYLNSISILSCSVLLFIIFKNIKIKSNFINLLASTTFGVYLIHDNFLVRRFLWEILFKNNEFYKSDYLLIHFVISVTIVYVLCVLVELFRKFIIYILTSIYGIIKLKLKRECNIL